MIEGVEPDPRGALDPGADSETRAPKPCSRRLDVEVDGTPSIVWCVREDGHDGPHAYPFPRVLPASDFMPIRGGDFVEDLV